jgi:pimeloyl-ACP methyl ester carboxylesterase
MPRINANGVDLHYLQAGSGPDLVMLHGLSGNLAVWHLRMVPMLEDRFRITTYDLRGHGYSSMPPNGYSTRDMAQDLAALLDELAIEQADLLGHSYGADIALHFALLHPSRVGRLISSSPGYPRCSTTGRTPPDGWRRGRRSSSGFRRAVPRERWTDVGYMLRRSVGADRVRSGRGLPWRRDRSPLMDATTISSDYEVVGEITLENLARIPHPKLLIYDAGSAWLSTFAILRDLLPRCTPVLLPSSELRHFAPLDAPELVVEHLTRFLAEAECTERAPVTAGLEEARSDGAVGAGGHELPE